MKQENTKSSPYRTEALTLPISGGKPESELFDRSRTERCNLHASTGYSFICAMYKKNEICL